MKWWWIISAKFEPLQESHFTLLLKWLNAPHVNKFWDTGIQWTEQSIREKYSSYVAGYKLVEGEKKPIHAFIITTDQPVGYIQYYDAYDFPRENNVDFKNTKFAEVKMAALDVFIGEEKALGMGSIAIRQFLDQHVWRDFDACLVDPEKTNKAAIRAYEKAGFFPFKEREKDLMMIICK